MKEVSHFQIAMILNHLVSQFNDISAISWDGKTELEKDHWIRVADSLCARFLIQEFSESLEGNPVGEKIAEVCSNIQNLLIAKNKNYGNSAFEVPLLCPECKDPSVLIRARMSDKIRRLATLLTGKPDEVGESIDDTLRDLAGYCVLLLVERGKETQE